MSSSIRDSSGRAGNSALNLGPSNNNWMDSNLDRVPNTRNTDANDITSFARDNGTVSCAAVGQTMTRKYARRTLDARVPLVPNDAHARTDSVRWSAEALPVSAPHSAQ